MQFSKLFKDCLDVPYPFTVIVLVSPYHKTEKEKIRISVLMQAGMLASSLTTVALCYVSCKTRSSEKKEVIKGPFFKIARDFCAGSSLFISLPYLL